MNNNALVLAKFNISNLNEMQNAMLDNIQQANDLILLSPTGSGKTLGFLLPLLQLLEEKEQGIQALIVVPSRELAIQIEQVFKQMGTNFKINCCYGGHSVRIEENNLTHPPSVLVGTPGRIAHHISKKNIDTQSLRTLVLDEFDKSLELGFKDEMEYVIGQCENLQKRILTSATNLKDIPLFVRLKAPIELNFLKSKEREEAPRLSYKTVKVAGDDKLEALMLLLGKIKSSSTLVFCNHREAVNRIADQLSQYKIDHGVYHGALDQIDREKTLIKFRNGSIPLLITTDLAARGLDIPEIEAVIHYQLPTTEDAMTHRNGRTARMHATGTVYFLLDKEDYLPSYFKQIPENESLPASFELPEAPAWKTLYIGAGKKDKINKMDIVGMLLKKGQLQKEELGRIEVLDHSAYVAIKRSKIFSTLQLVKEEKIKNKKVKMEVSS